MFKPQGVFINLFLGRTRQGADWIKPRLCQDFRTGDHFSKGTLQGHYKVSKLASLHNTLKYIFDNCLA